jgi:DNA-binding protein YbaB
MSTAEHALVAKVEELRAKQRRAQQALALVRGKGYGLNAAVVVELDAGGEVLRLEIDEAASKYDMASVASGVRRAFADARKDAEKQVEQALGEFTADTEMAQALEELQSHFGIAPKDGPSRPNTAAPGPGEDDYEPPASWLERA